MPAYLAAPANADLNNAFFAAAAGSAQAGQRILPAVLYRQQVANTLFPEVPGTVVQCSPLMTRLSLESASGDLRLRDPFIGVTGVNITSATNFTPLSGTAPGTITKLYLHLLDTKPVLSGARYQYWLVRFQPNGEPAETVDAGQIDVP